MIRDDGPRHPAVVIGGGVAGLVAAQVLSRQMEVALVERDRPADIAGDRPGVPQAGHTHLMLRRGYVELERLFPGFDAALDRAGAEPIDWLADVIWIGPGGVYPQFQSGMRSRSASRSAFEASLREEVLRQPSVRLVSGHTVVGLSGDSRQVAGVALRERPVRGFGAAEASGEPPAGNEVESADTMPTQLPARLVVDATGRSSPLPKWLGELGISAPRETVVDAFLGYATRLYKKPNGARDWKGLYIRDRPPSSTRGGAVFPIEGDRWVVTLGGAGVDKPPVDEAGFLDFASRLLSPRLHEAISAAEPLTPIRGWARTSNRWRHYTELVDYPTGLVVLGDALCALNPVYGQGMSVAAMEGRLLAEWLEQPATQSALARSQPLETRGLMHKVARTARLPWQLATSEDARIDGAAGGARLGPGSRLIEAYFSEVLTQAASDPLTYRRFAEVTQLVGSPARLFDPRVAVRVVAGLGRRAFSGRSAGR